MNALHVHVYCLNVTNHIVRHPVLRPHYGVMQVSGSPVCECVYARKLGSVVLLRFVGFVCVVVGLVLGV